jgi:hypothetical protein
MNRVLYQLLGGNGGGIDGAVIDHCDLWFMLDTEDRLMFHHKNGMVWLHVVDQTIFEDLWTILDRFLLFFTNSYNLLQSIQITTNYYKLFQIITNYYKLWQIITNYYKVLHSIT